MACLERDFDPEDGVHVGWKALVISYGYLGILFRMWNPKWLFTMGWSAAIINNKTRGDDV